MQTMGTQNFTDSGYGDTPREAYADARERAAAEYGHEQGYSGHINSQRGHGFRLHPVIVPAAGVEALRDHYVNAGGGNERPALAVRIAKPVTVSEREVTVRVAAKDMWEAQAKAAILEQQKGERQAKTGQYVDARAPQPGVKVKEGKAPKLVSVKATGATARLRATRVSDGRVLCEVGSRKELTEWLERRLTAEPEADGTAFRVERVLQTETLTVQNRPAGLPVFEVKVKVAVVRAGEATNQYVFIGYAVS
jgi:hypothetical protein